MPALAATTTDAKPTPKKEKLKDVEEGDGGGGAKGLQRKRAGSISVAALDNETIIEVKMGGDEIFLLYDLQ